MSWEEMQIFSPQPATVDFRPERSFVGERETRYTHTTQSIITQNETLLKWEMKTERLV